MGPVTYTYEELVALKKSGVPEAALENLSKTALEITSSPTVKVTDIELPRPSNDIHDFTCISQYRWPNPDTPDGLPWIWKDGEVNRATQTGIGPGRVYGNLRILALAEFYFGGGEYAEYANRQLYDWFINPETKVNPNGKYSQSIPGICDGTAPGLIVFSQNFELFNGMGILEAMGLLNPEIKEGVRVWFDDFTNWLFTHENGITESYAGNNHGSWYDSQVLAPLVYFGHRPAVVKNICKKAYEWRFRMQIMPDGSQPHELARRTPISYSLYNLSALSVLASLMERLGYTEPWGIDAERGVCILKSAVDFVIPYALDITKCPVPTIETKSYASRIGRYMLAVAKRYPELGYAERAAEYIAAHDIWRLEPSL